MLMMKYFGSIFVLCFLGFLLTQTRALPSWKNCTDQAACRDTNEFCAGLGDSKCIPCSMDEIGPTASGVKPSWCATASPKIMIDSSSVLTFAKWGGWDGEDSSCPSYNECARNCRESYTVEKRATSYVLTSTFKSTLTCECDQLIFVNGTGGSWGGTHFGLKYSFLIGLSSEVTMHQIDANTLDIWMYRSSSLGIEDCGWEYSIGTVSPPPSLSPPPLSSSGNSLFRADLFGIVSALTMMSALILA